MEDLSVVFTYKTKYADIDGKKITLAFGLCEAIVVNKVIGIHTSRKWKLILGVDRNKSNLSCWVFSST